ncbi:MAG TPA: CARDB domain-containing protein [Candidatus Thermoplasmatota archaeon]|nr:CARDB domain-containing protein [Candidatus Thermoplasmatota archaeon]
MSITAPSAQATIIGETFTENAAANFPKPGEEFALMRISVADEGTDDTHDNITAVRVSLATSPGRIDVSQISKVNVTVRTTGTNVRFSETTTAGDIETLITTGYNATFTKISVHDGVTARIWINLTLASNAVPGKTLLGAANVYVEDVDDSESCVNQICVESVADTQISIVASPTLPDFTITGFTGASSAGTDMYVANANNTILVTARNANASDYQFLGIDSVQLWYRFSQAPFGGPQFAQQTNAWTPLYLHWNKTTDDNLNQTYDTNPSVSGAGQWVLATPVYTDIGTDTVNTTNILFQLQNGSGYYEFFVRATDKAGAVEQVPTTFDARALIDEGGEDAFLLRINNNLVGHEAATRTGISATVEFNSTHSLQVSGAVTASDVLCLKKPGNITVACRDGPSASWSNIVFDTLGHWWIQDGVSSTVGKNFTVYVNVTPQILLLTQPASVVYSKTSFNASITTTVTWPNGTAAQGALVQVWAPTDTPGVNHPRRNATVAADGTATVNDIPIANNGTGIYQVTAVLGATTYSLSAPAAGLQNWTVTATTPAAVIALNNATGGFSTGNVTANFTFASDGKSLLGTLTGTLDVARQFNITVTRDNAIFAYLNATRSTPSSCAITDVANDTTALFINISCPGSGNITLQPNGVWQTGTYSIEVRADTVGTTGAVSGWEYIGSVAFTVPSPTPGVVIRQGETIIWDTRTNTGTNLIERVVPPGDPGTSAAGLNLTFEFIGRLGGEAGGPTGVTDTTALHQRSNRSGANVTISGDVLFGLDTTGSSTTRCGTPYAWAVVYGDICVSASRIGYDTTTNRYFAQILPTKSGGSVDLRFRWSNPNITLDESVSIPVRAAVTSGVMTVTPTTMGTSTNTTVTITWREAGGDPARGRIQVSAFDQSGARVFTGFTVFDSFGATGAAVTVNGSTNAGAGAVTVLYINASADVVGRHIVLNASQQLADGSEISHALAKIAVVPTHDVVVTVNNTQAVAGNPTVFQVNVTRLGLPFDADVWFLTTQEVADLRNNGTLPTLSDAAFARTFTASASGVRASTGNYSKSIILTKVDPEGIYFVYARNTSKTHDNLDGLVQVTVRNVTVAFTPNSVPLQIGTVEAFQNITVNVSVTNPFTGAPLNGTLTMVNHFDTSHGNAWVSAFGAAWTNGTTFTVTNGWIGQGVNVTGIDLGVVNFTFTMATTSATAASIDGTFTVVSPDITISPDQIASGRATTVTVTVRDVEGLPLSGLNIAIQCPGASGNATTGANGAASLRLAPTAPGLCPVLINGTATGRFVTVATSALVIVISPGTSIEQGGQVTVTVRDVDETAALTATPTIRITPPSGADITVNAATHTFVPTQLGTYSVQATATGYASATASFAVVEPTPGAAFNYTNFDVQPRTVTAGDVIVATVNVTNTGGRDGTTQVALIINGAQRGSPVTVNLAPGASQPVTLSYTTTSQDVGTLSVRVGDATPITVTVNAFQPPTSTFAYSGLQVQPTTVTAGDAVTVRCTVQNTGTAAGSVNVPFKLNGATVATVPVTLNAQASETVQAQVTVPAGTPAGQAQVSCGDTAAQTVTVNARGPGVPGFEGLAAIGALGAALFVLRRKN